MNIDAIVILSGGTVSEIHPDTGEPAFRSTTYAEGDAFGVLGGYARVEAAALLAKEYSSAVLVPTGAVASHGRSHASIIKDELIGLGIPGERIVLEEKSTNTQTQIVEVLVLAKTNGWKEIVFVTNEYQLERVQAFVEHLSTPIPCRVMYQSAEEILSRVNPDFVKTFIEIQTHPEYVARVDSEKKGVEAIRRGEYHSSAPEDKQERKV